MILVSPNYSLANVILSIDLRSELISCYNIHSPLKIGQALIIFIKVFSTFQVSSTFVSLNIQSSISYKNYAKFTNLQNGYLLR